MRRDRAYRRPQAQGDPRAVATELATANNMALQQEVVGHRHPIKRDIQRAYIAHGLLIDRSMGKIILLYQFYCEKYKKSFGSLFCLFQLEKNQRRLEYRSHQNLRPNEENKYFDGKV